MVSVTENLAPVETGDLKPGRVYRQGIASSSPHASKGSPEISSFRSMTRSGFASSSASAPDWWRVAGA